MLGDVRRFEPVEGRGRGKGARAAQGRPLQDLALCGMDKGGLEGFAEEDGAFGNLEAEGVVDALGEGVGDGCVGGEFAAAL